MKPRTFFTIGATIALLLVCFAVLSIFHYSNTQRYTSNLTPVKPTIYQPGELVILKPGKIYGVVLDNTNEGVSVCVPDTSGGVKTQLVSPLILERYHRW
jgi:uncharacterized BrkB/YihY/UPF0761 family membrane protein